MFTSTEQRTPEAHEKTGPNAARVCALAPFARPIPASTAIEAESLAEPLIDGEPVIQTFVPSSLREAAFSLNPAAARATVVLATWNAPTSASH